MLVHHIHTDEFSGPSLTAVRGQPCVAPGGIRRDNYTPSPVDVQKRLAYQGS